MKFDEYADYLRAANETANIRLKEGILSLALGNFHRFRKTKGFKSMPFRDLKKYLMHEYLEFEFEKEVCA